MRNLQFAAVLAFVGCTFFAFQCLAKSGTLLENETWSGSVAVDGDIIVPEGVKLEILPGAHIVFKYDRVNQNRYKLVIYGKIVAVGTEFKPISFCPDSNSPPVVHSRSEKWHKSALWQGIIITGLGSQGVFNNCVITGAYTAINVDSQCQLTNCKIVSNESAGIYCNSAILNVNDSEIADGQYGIHGTCKSFFASGNKIRNHQRGVYCTIESGMFNNNSLVETTDALTLIIINNTVEVCNNNLYRHDNAGIAIKLQTAEVQIRDNEMMDIPKGFVFRGDGIVYLSRNSLRQCKYGLYVYDTPTVVVRGSINDERDPETNRFTRIAVAPLYPYSFSLESDGRLLNNNAKSIQVSENSFPGKLEYLYSSSETGSAYIKGKVDGSLLAKGEPGWVAAGIFLGPLGILTAYSYPVNPPIENLMNQPIDYTYGFTESYKATSKAKNAAYALGGWATWILIYLAFRD